MCNKKLRLFPNILILRRSDHLDRQIIEIQAYPLTMSNVESFLGEPAEVTNRPFHQYNTYFTSRVSNLKFGIVYIASTVNVKFN